MIKIEDKLFKDFTQFKVSHLGISERRCSRGECCNSILVVAGLISPARSHKSHENKQQLQELTEHLEKQVTLLLF